MNFLKEKRPESITYTRNDDGTYKVVYTGIVGVADNNEVFVNANVRFPKCKLDWSDHGVLPTPSINEILKDDDDDETLLNVVIPDNNGRGDLRKQDLDHVESVLNQYGISIKDDGNNYRPVNEVMRDIAALLKFDLNTSGERTYSIMKHNIMMALLGARYINFI